MVILYFKLGGQVGLEIFSPQTAQVDGALWVAAASEKALVGPGAGTAPGREARSWGGAICSVSCRIIRTRRDSGYGAAESGSPASVWCDLGEGALSLRELSPAFWRPWAATEGWQGGPGLRLCWEPGFMPLLLWVQHQHLVTSSLCSGAWSMEVKHLACVKKSQPPLEILSPPLYFSFLFKMFCLGRK